MRFFIVVLGLSTLAVAGPLPSLSKNALKARAQPSTLANNTLDPDSIAAWYKLKATYDSLNDQAPDLKARSSDSISASANITLGPDVVAALNELEMIYNSVNAAEHNRTLIEKRAFWSWFKKALHEDGLYARSSTSANVTLGPDVVVGQNELKTNYDNLNKAERDSTMIEKRDFDSWFDDVEDKLAEEGLWPRSSTMENYTLSPESIAALTKLKAEYDSRNEKRMESDLTKRGLGHWFKMMFDAPGLGARSSDSNSMAANFTLDPDTIVALTHLKAKYDSFNQKRAEKGLTERGLGHWFKMMFEAPGLKARSSDSNSMAANFTLDPDTIAALTILKAKYDSFNQKRAEKGLTERGLGHWFKMMFDAPGLKARSAIPTSTPANITLDADSVAALTNLKAVYDSLNEKRTDSGVVVKRGFWHFLIYGTPNDNESNASDIDDLFKEKRTDNGVITKRGLWSWLKKMYGTPPNVQISSR